MARDEDDADGLPPIGEGTKDCLEDAKKGKPRSFLLICKGSKVKYLKVKKKPVKPGEIAEAKKLGYKGDAYIGVITGQGMNLVFNLAISEGYESEPVKDTVLKTFLDEQAGFKSKATFAIVPVPPELPFDEDDLAHPLIARFVKLTELIPKAVEVQPSAESELRLTASQIRGLLQDADFKTAEPKVDALEKRLQELLSGVASGEPKDSTDDDRLKQKLLEAFNKLVPQIKQAVVDYPDRKAELLKPVSEIKQQLDSNDLQNAKVGILELGTLLKSLGPSATSTPNVDPLRLEYETKLAIVQRLYDQALAKSVGDTNKYQTVMAYVLAQADASGYANVLKALDKLHAALLAALNSPTKDSDPNTQEERSGGPSLNDLEKARLEWIDRRNEAIRMIEELQHELIEEFEDTGQDTELENAIKRLNVLIADLSDELEARLDAFIKAPESERANGTQQVRETLQKFQAIVDADEVMVQIDGNEVLPDTYVVAPLKQSLQAIESSLR